MAIDNYRMSKSLAEKFKLSSDEIIFIQDLLDMETILRETEKVDYLRNDNHLYKFGIFDVEKNRAFIYLKDLELSNLIDVLDTEKVADSLARKGLILIGWVLSKQVVAIDWEKIGGV